MSHVKCIAVVLVVVVSGFVVPGTASDHTVQIKPGDTCAVDADTLTVWHGDSDTIVWQLKSPATAPHHKVKVKFKLGPAGAPAGTPKTPCSGTKDFDVPQHPGSSLKCIIAPDTYPGRYKYEILDANGLQCEDPSVDVQDGRISVSGSMKKAPAAPKKSPAEPKKP